MPARDLDPVTILGYCLQLPWWLLVIERKTRFPKRYVYIERERCLIEPGFKAKFNQSDKDPHFHISSLLVFYEP